MRKNLLLLFLHLFAIIYSQEQIFTQKEIDAFEITPNNPEKHLEYKKMLETDTTLTGWVYYYRKKSYYHLIKYEHDSAIYFAKKGVERYHQLLDPPSLEERQLKDIYLYSGMVLTQKQKYRQSTEHLLKALDISKKYPKDKLGSNPFIYGYLARNFIKMGDKKKALEYRLLISKDSLYMSSAVNAGGTYNHIGILYDYLGIKDSALHYYQKSLKSCLESNNYGHIRGLYNNIGAYYLDQGKTDSTLFYFRKSKELLDLHPKANYGNSKYFTYSNNAYVLLKEGKTNEAIKNLNMVLDSIKSIQKIDEDIKDLKVITINYLTEAYQKNNQLKKALEISEEKSDFLTQFHQQILDEKLRDLNIAYEVKEKNESIQQLKATSQEQNTIIKQRNIIALILGVLLFSILGIGLLIIKQRKLKNKYETANLEQRLLRSQLNPHFVFNALSTANNLANKNSENTSPYITKLAGLIRLILKNSREEFVSLEDELKSIEDYLELQSSFSKKFDYKIDMNPIIDKEEIYIPPMFIQPFIENSIEHGIKGVKDGLIEISINIDSDDKLLKCKIKDNGIGVSNTSKFMNSNENKYVSFSGKILKERLHIYSKSLNKKAKYTVSDSIEGEGTEVNISLPYILEL